MITKAYVEQLYTTTAKVRIPVFDKPAFVTDSTPSPDLAEATVSFLPNCKPNLKVGDVVFVAFEDNDIGKPVIIGHLYRTAKTETYSDLILNSLKVNIDATFSKDVKIGKVKSQEISYLEGLTGNIQKQLDDLLSAKDELKNLADSLQTKLTILEDTVNTLSNAGDIGSDDYEDYPAESAPIATAATLILRGDSK